MPAIVEEILADSIAEELSLAKGDEILKINDVVPKDLIDYKYLMNSEEVTVEVKKADGTLEIIEIEKDFEDDLGIVFENAVFDMIKKCTNKCVFCFVDQQPEGLRESLYVKDDDYRLSYLQGTYVTLTNFTAADKKRISDLGLGPLYVSLHTTNPELRVKMLANPKAANIIEDLKWFQKQQIPLHLQIVLCPGYNDDEELEKTFKDLEKFKDIILSVAIVPVGLTKFRKTPLKPVDKACAKDVIAKIDAFNKKLRKNVACASDEFFITADEKVPPAKYYGNFAQLDDGVGVIRLVLDDFEKNKKKLPKKIKTPKNIHILTAPAGQRVFKYINDEFNKIENLTSVLVTVSGKFFGENITVAGLVTGSDIIEQLKNIQDEIEILLIPSVMLRPFTRTFLDDLTVEDVEKALSCKIEVMEDVYSTKSLLKFISSL